MLKHYVDMAIGLVAFAVVLYIAGTFVTAFARETGTTAQRALAACRDSATVLWAKLVGLGAMSLTCAGTISDWAGDSGLKDWMQQNLDPKYVGAGIGVLMFVTFLARLRTIAKPGGQ